MCEICRCRCCVCWRVASWQWTILEPDDTVQTFPWWVMASEETGGTEEENLDYIRGIKLTDVLDIWAWENPGCRCERFSLNKDQECSMELWSPVMRHHQEMIVDFRKT